MNQGVIGVYSYQDSVLSAIKKLKDGGYRNMRVFSPCPDHEIEEAVDLPESPVRFFTLFGGLLGASCGIGFTVLTSSSWPIAVSAKPIVSIIPYMVIVFELTVLFGALSTFLGLIVNSLIIKRTPVRLYDERFSDDKFGVAVICKKEKMNEVEAILNSTGAEEIKFDGA